MSGDLVFLDEEDLTEQERGLLDAIEEAIKTHAGSMSAADVLACLVTALRCEAYAAGMSAPELTEAMRAAAGDNAAWYRDVVLRNAEPEGSA